MSFERMCEFTKFSLDSNRFEKIDDLLFNPNCSNNSRIVPNFKEKEGKIVEHSSKKIIESQTTPPTDSAVSRKTDPYDKFSRVQDDVDCRRDWHRGWNNVSRSRFTFHAQVFLEKVYKLPKMPKIPTISSIEILQHRKRN